MVVVFVVHSVTRYRKQRSLLRTNESINRISTSMPEKMADDINTRLVHNFSSE